MTDTEVGGGSGVIVTCGAVLTHGNAARPLVAYLTYQTVDPMAVTVILASDAEGNAFDPGADASPWMFGRDLLDSALAQPDTAVGGGDVEVTWLTEKDVLRLTLTDGESGQRCPVYIDGAPARRFMAASLALLPAELEAVDVDALIADLLDDGSAQ